jgi:hypothetical protein
MSSKWRKLTVAGVLGTVLLAGVHRARSEFVVYRLTQPGPHLSHIPLPSPQERVAYARRSDQFNRIWSARSQRDVAAELIPYLQDPDEYLRIRAARALGLLESPAAEAPLAARIKEMQPDTPWEAVELVKLQLALGRIRARNLRGEARVTRVIQSVGLSLPDLGRVTERINGPQRSASSTGTPGYAVVQDVVELLYAMAKRGEDIRPVTARLTLTPAQQLTLQGAPMPLEQEITLFLDYLSQLSVLNGDHRVVEERLLGLGSKAKERIIQRLDEMRRHPEQYRQPGSYAVLFRLAVETGDPRIPGLVQLFERHAHPDIRYDAEQTLKSIERRKREREELERLSASQPTP